MTAPGVDEEASALEVAYAAHRSAVLALEAITRSEALAAGALRAAMTRYVAAAAEAGTTEAEVTRRLAACGVEQVEPIDPQEAMRLLSAALTAKFELRSSAAPDMHLEALAAANSASDAATFRFVVSALASQMPTSRIAAEIGHDADALKFVVLLARARAALVAHGAGEPA